MCKYDRTLRDIIEECPMRFEEVIYSNDLDKYNKDLSYNELYKLYKKHADNTSAIITRKNDNLYCGFKHSCLTRVGDRFFIDSSYDPVLIISPRSIKVKRDPSHFFKFFCEKYKIKYDYLPKILGMPPKILKDVLIGKIWGKESLYKDWMSVLGIKNVSWKVFEKYISRFETHYLYDLQAFTKNLENSMKALIDFVDQKEDARVYIDALDSAAQLNQVIDFTWSKKRMEAEHQKQINTLLEHEILSKKIDPIYSHTINSKNISMLNSELDIFMEAQNMHHCLYNCYYNKIKNHAYLAFHMNSPESATFGVRRTCTGKIALDQIYLKYDQPVSEETRKIAIEFIVENRDILSNLLDFNPKDGYDGLAVWNPAPLNTLGEPIEF